MAKLKQRQKAQKLALQGQIAAAVEELSAMQASGDIESNVSLAEIAAYSGNWLEVLQLVEVLFGTPDCMVTQNVYEDMARLAARAGEELKEWTEVLRIAKFAKTKLSRQNNDEMRFATIRQLTRLAERKGKGSFFPELGSLAKRKSEFKDDVASSSDDDFDTPQEKTNTLYSFAMSSAYPPGALEIFDQAKALPESFDEVVFLAAALADAGREAEAWRVIRSSLKFWWPVDVAQVLPVALLVDESIKSMMTPKRCAEILRTPRGPMANAT